MGEGAAGGRNEYWYADLSESASIFVPISMSISMSMTVYVYLCAVWWIDNG